MRSGVRVFGQRIRARVSRDNGSRDFERGYTMATNQTGTSGATGSTRGSTGTQQGAGMQGRRVSDPAYDLISVMYHTLQGCETYEQYAQDAEQAGQQEIAQFFRDTGQQFERCAERGRQLLAQCLQQAQG